MTDRDKLLHIIVSIIGVGILFAIFSIVFNKRDSLIIAGIAMFYVGIFKEIVWDKIMEKGTPEVMDVVANTIGIIIAVVLIIM